MIFKFKLVFVLVFPHHRIIISGPSSPIKTNLLTSQWRTVSSFTTTTEIDYEITRLADEIQEIELLHKNLQKVRKLLGNAISAAQSASRTPPVSPNNHTLNSSGTTEASTNSSSQSGSGTVSSGGDRQRICSCSPADNCIGICVNPRVTQEMEQHLAATTAQQQRSPPPSALLNAPGSVDCSINGNMGSPPPRPPSDHLSSHSSGGTGSTMAEFHVRRYPGISGGSPGAPTSSGSGSTSTVAGFRLRRVPTPEQGQVVVGVPMPFSPVSPLSHYSNYCNSDSDPATTSSFQSNQQELNYFQQQYPHITQHYKYSPQQQNIITY